MLTVDVVDRHIESRVTEEGAPTEVLCTKRLLLKQGSLPSWAPRGILKNSESWVLEESEVDLTPSAEATRPRTMSIWTRNLDHTAVLAVTEGIRYQEEAPSMTGCATLADIRSQITFSLLRRRIEAFGLKRYMAHKDTSRQGLIWSMEHLAHLIDPTRSSYKDTAPPTSRTKTQRLLHALRPPFLDGYPLGPIQWAKRRWNQWKARRAGRDELED